MLYTTPIPDIPVASVFNGLSYSPALLLDARLSASITDDPDFHSACEWGFNYCVGEIEDGERGLCTGNEAKAFVRDDMLAVHVVVGQASLVNRVGVNLGWLSALALFQYQSALQGLSLLSELAGQELYGKAAA